MKTIFALFFLLLLTAPPALSQDSMKFVYFENFAPFSWKGDGRVQGILIDAVDEIVGKEMGISVSHTGYPWKRAQKMVEAGQADAFITVPTEKRRTYTVIGNAPVVYSSIILFTHKENHNVRSLKTINTLSDLKGFTTVNYIGNGWAEKNLRGLDVFWVPTVDQALFLIANNRYDFYAGGERYVRFNLKRLGFKARVVATPIVLESTAYHLCVGKHSSFIRILPTFDEAMREFRKNGDLQKIIARYE